MRGPSMRVVVVVVLNTRAAGGCQSLSKSFAPPPLYGYWLLVLNNILCFPRSDLLDARVSLRACPGVFSVGGWRGDRGESKNTIKRIFGDTSEDFSYDFYSDTQRY